MTASTRVSKRLRFEILHRDGHTCRYCGATAPEARLTVDHVLPVALGGSNDPANLVTACADCNSGKTSTSPSAEVAADVSEDALRWADAVSSAAAEFRNRRDAAGAELDRWLQRWSAWTSPAPDGTRRTVPLPDGWQASVRSMMEAGAHIDDLIELVDVAMTSRAKDRFRYFCGCGWNHVRALHDRATQILSGDVSPTEHPGYDADDDIRNAYWTGHVAGFNDGYQDGWELGLAAGRAENADRARNDDPLPLSQILRKAKDE